MVAAALLAGCSARVQVDSNGGASGMGSGNSITGNSAGLHVQANSNSFAAAIIAISLLAGSIEHSREERPFPSPAALFPEQPVRAPELAPDRRVNEQDCRQPLDFSSGNLRCK